MKSLLELLAKMVGFAGGLILTLDALSIRRKIRIEAGARLLIGTFEKSGKGDLLKDSAGQPLSDPRVFQVWLARRPLIFAIVGFALVTLGFVLDLLAYFWPS